MNNNPYMSVVDVWPVWHGQRACVGIPPEVFFPAPNDRAGVREAKAICGDCPVRNQCLDEALDNRITTVCGVAYPNKNAPASSTAATSTNPPAHHKNGNPAPVSTAAPTHPNHNAPAASHAQTATNSKPTATT
jgi:hypothetical protein